METELYEKVIDLNVKYINEMMAEGAWCGHVYATEYFSDIRENIIKISEEIMKKYNRNDIKYLTSHISFCLSTDYDELITKIYRDDNFSEREKYEIADALNDTFKDKLEQAFSDFECVYEKLTGRNYKEVLEATLGY